MDTFDDRMLQPGTPVQVTEGYTGVIQHVIEGPHGKWSYGIVLDNGAGSGEWAPMEVDALSTVESKTARTAARSGAPLLDAEEAASQGLHLAVSDYPEFASSIWDHPDHVEVVKGVPSRTLPGLFGALDEDLAVSVSRQATKEPQKRSQASVVTPVRPPVRREAIDRYWERPEADPVGDSVRDPDQPLWYRKVVGPAVDRFNQGLEPAYRVTDLSERSNNNWCRFLSGHTGHCFFPKGLDEAETRRQGKPVWIPVDRGACPRVSSRELQRACPVGEPGRNSGERVTYPDIVASKE